jgi:hypothetical protein
MKRNKVRTILFFATLLSMAAVATAKDHGACSSANLAGEYGFTLTGTLIPPSGPIPFAAVGRNTSDGMGNVSGTQTSSVGGLVSDNALKGTATVNPDCTGTLTLNIYDQSENLLRTAVIAVVFDDDGNELRGTFKSLIVYPGGISVPSVVTLNGRKMFPDRGIGQ